jgi:hypothetical protein
MNRIYNIPTEQQHLHSYVFYPQNGMGDRLLDIIGVMTFCKYKNLQMSVYWDNPPVGNNEWIYSQKLFKFPFQITNEMSNFFIYSKPSLSGSPHMLHKILTSVNFDDIVQSVSQYAKAIRPSDIVEKYIPVGIHKAYGIHLRATDKITENREAGSYSNSKKEFDDIIFKLLHDVKNTLLMEITDTFFITSEDETWKFHITDKIRDIAKELGKNVTFLDTDITSIDTELYTGIHAVVDMFSLSRCKCIMQGTKYSTFSIFASLVGSRQLRNYHFKHDDPSLLYLWSPCINVNFSNSVYNPDICSKITETHAPITLLFCDHSLKT